MTDIGWKLLGAEQQMAARVAASLIEDADMRFVMMLFGDDKQGAVVSNIEPADAVKLIEAALMAAKARADTEEIQGDWVQ